MFPRAPGESARKNRVRCPQSAADPARTGDSPSAHTRLGFLGNGLELASSRSGLTMPTPYSAMTELVSDFCLHRQIAAATRFTVVNSLKRAVEIVINRGPPDRRWQKINTRGHAADTPLAVPTMSGVAVERQILSRVVETELRNHRGSRLFDATMVSPPHGCVIGTSCPMFLGYPESARARCGLAGTRSGRSPHCCDAGHSTSGREFRCAT